MMVRRVSPGACPICGAAHTACTGEAGAIAVAQLPARDAASALAVTTGTYRGPRKRTPALDVPTSQPSVTGL